MPTDVTAFFDPATSTLTYLVADPATGASAVIDSVRDFDQKSGRTGTASADKVVAAIRDRGLHLEWILETHVHADHLSAAPYLKQQLGGRTGIGARVTEVQSVFRELFEMGAICAADGREFDHLFADGETFRIGGLDGRVIASPGHTPACVAYLIGDALFVGDTLFMPDYGTARCDFPGGDARQLYRSIRRLLNLPPATRVFTGHDYQPNGRPLAFEASVAEQRAKNIHIRDGIGEDEFAGMRETRDRTLSLPNLILPSVQVNIRAGELPPAEPGGHRYLKIPLDAM
ncbi:MBL fold metallo-hydrolase [Desertibaculum subflavum]|uniref:MBL fold metallo-hydrolase n=1 Tax=Desertibaculum subflavum TaxID=2268458 RepID=UPI000E65ECA7